jgi:imidazolonepropionase-like amidohydrolase
LGIETDVGGVFEGAVADLLVPSASPIEDIANTRAIEAVLRA